MVLMILSNQIDRNECTFTQIKIISFGFPNITHFLRIEPLQIDCSPFLFAQSRKILNLHYQHVFQNVLLKSTTKIELDKIFKSEKWEIETKQTEKKSGHMNISIENQFLKIKLTINKSHRAHNVLIYVENW